MHLLVVLAFLLAFVGAPSGGGGLDYTSRNRAPVTQGWAAGPCPGAIGPVRCLTGDDAAGGPVFLDTWPVGQIRQLRDARTVGEVQRGFRRIARELFVEFRDDRARFCPGYHAVRMPVVGRKVGGRIGVRWGEVLLAPDGTVDEQYLHYGLVRGGVEYLLWAEAVAADACYPEELTHWRPRDLRAARHPLDVAVARAVLPSPRSLLPERTAAPK